VNKPKSPYRGWLEILLALLLLTLLGLATGRIIHRENLINDDSPKVLIAPGEMK
jgi:hypothetical protein